MDVYTKIYPKWLPSADAMELETFIELIHERFGVDLLPTWNEEMTLGEVFQSTSHS